jgi:hypothetical protein
MRSITRKIRNTVLFGLATVIGVSTIAAPADAAPRARWSYVGRYQFTVEDETTNVPLYLNVNSFEGSYDYFTLTYQARYNGRTGIDRVNIGVVVDCNDWTAEADQMYVYYSKNKYDYVHYEGGFISDSWQADALSHC